MKIWSIWDKKSFGLIIGPQGTKKIQRFLSRKCCFLPLFLPVFPFSSAQPVHFNQISVLCICSYMWVVHTKKNHQKISTQYKIIAHSMGTVFSLEMPPFFLAAQLSGQICTTSLMTRWRRRGKRQGRLP